MPHTINAKNIDSSLANVAEKNFMKDLQCSEGFWGEQNVDIVESNGVVVKFRLIQPFSSDLNEIGVWFENTDRGESLHDCHLVKDAGPGEVLDSFEARCTNGHATINVYGGSSDSFKYNQIGIEDEVPDAVCQPSIRFPEFNPLKRCFWTFKLNCEPSRESKRELDMTGETTDQNQSVTAQNIEKQKTGFCEEESKLVDVQLIPIDKCSAAISVHPIKLESQDGETVTFTISQVWKGCDSIKTNDNLGWIAADYEARDGELQCAKMEALECGAEFEFTATCTDGVTLVDLYTHDEGFTQADDSIIMVPSACGGKADGFHTCHFRYLLKCFPSKCLAKTGQRLGRSYGRSRPWFGIL
jgi:hypothetical protein